jgi:F-box and WD-40 domain protein CDC4
MVNDDMAWKSLCEKYSYEVPVTKDFSDMPTHEQHEEFTRAKLQIEGVEETMNPDVASNIMRQIYWPEGVGDYRSFFKQRFMVETAWRSGGHCDSRQITPDQGVVTSLHLTHKYIIVALDNAKIHVFDVLGNHKRTLLGHVMGVWAMVPWGDLLVSGGCDRDVRVWNLSSG